MVVFWSFCGPKLWDCLACVDYFFDTPPDELVALINALKSILLDPSTLSASSEANSLPVLRALDARLADFESVLPPSAHLRNDLHEMCVTSAQARLDKIRRLQTAQRNLSRSSLGSTSSSYAGSSVASAHHISLAGLYIYSIGNHRLLYCIFNYSRHG